jgi:hypothetical protein
VAFSQLDGNLLLLSSFSPTTPYHVAANAIILILYWLNGPGPVYLPDSDVHWAFGSTLTIGNYFCRPTSYLHAPRLFHLSSGSYNDRVFLDVPVT